MKNYKRSVCSTCSYVSFCSLTTDKSNISSCSEYLHRLDEECPQITKVPIEILRSSDGENNKNLVLI